MHNAGTRLAFHGGQEITHIRILAQAPPERCRAYPGRVGRTSRGGARTISNLERGIKRAPYRDTVRRLADALGLSGEDLTQFVTSARRPLKHSSRGNRMGSKAASSARCRQLIW
jgi:hypothetical protein